MAILDKISFLKKRKKNLINSYLSALNWIKDNSIPEKGIVVTSKQRVPYLEVTGYMIPTLINAGELSIAEQYAEFLSYMQRPDGSFAGPDGKEYVFDTGQALDGFLSASSIWPRFKNNAERAAEYISSVIDASGQINSTYNYPIVNLIHVFVLPKLFKASKMFNEPKYENKAKLSVSYYKKSSGILDINYLTHFLAYIQDGMIDCGEKEFISQSVSRIFNTQKPNGSITALPNVKWICSTGLIQLSIVGYKCGLYEQAEKAFNYAMKLQNSSGGFYGSYGMKCDYFPSEEISWANKFFLDAVHIKISSFFDHNKNIFPKQITPDDPRLLAILASFGDLNGKKVLDAGCGKGRFAAIIKDKFPDCDIHGIDISQELLKSAPPNLTITKGSILNLPYDNETFDCVFCVEALEHCLRTDKAVSELCRVLKNNGNIIIIDKDINKNGLLKITNFEQWFDTASLKRSLEAHCAEVKIAEIDMDDVKLKGLFFECIGKKSSGALSQDQWHNAIISEMSYKDLVKKILRNEYPEWIKPLLNNTNENDSILELGSGTGELSAILGLYKRSVYLLDYSKKNLEFSKMLFTELKIDGKFFCMDILNKFPLLNNSVDWVFSSGLLEHFSDEEICGIMKSSGSVCKKGVMSLVPNYNAIFYLLGKEQMEKEGKWIYGKEEPKKTMVPFFENAGLINIKEFSVGTYHSLEFIKKHTPGIKNLFDNLNFEQLSSIGQGYLLFTIGEKNA